MVYYVYTLQADLKIGGVFMNNVADAFPPRIPTLKGGRWTYNGKPCPDYRTAVSLYNKDISSLSPPDQRVPYQRGLKWYYRDKPYETEKAARQAFIRYTDRTLVRVEEPEWLSDSYWEGRASIVVPPVHVPRHAKLSAPRKDS